MKGKGKCLCGAIEVEAELSNNEMAACHCNMCRKWQGGPMLAIECAEALKISNTDALVRYSSSEWAERGFCRHCGTHLFYYLKPNGQYHLPIGLLDGEANYQFSHQIFIDEKPGYYEFKNETHNMTGEEVFAHFAQNQ